MFAPFMTLSNNKQNSNIHLMWFIANQITTEWKRVVTSKYTNDCVMSACDFVCYQWAIDYEFPNIYLLTHVYHMPQNYNIKPVRLTNLYTHKYLMRWLVIIIIIIIINERFM